MARFDDSVTQSLVQARALLIEAEPRRPSALGALAAGFAAATAAVLLAGAVILGPGVTLDDPAVVAEAGV